MASGGLVQPSRRPEGLGHFDLTAEILAEVQGTEMNVAGLIDHGARGCASTGRRHISNPGEDRWIANFTCAYMQASDAERIGHLAASIDPRFGSWCWWCGPRAPGKSGRAALDA
jgi:hypothetical protein